MVNRPLLSRNIFHLLIMQGAMRDIGLSMNRFAAAHNTAYNIPNYSLFHPSSHPFLKLYFILIFVFCFLLAEWGTVCCINQMQTPIA